MAERTQGAAAVMQTDLVREPGPRKRIYFQDIVKKFHEFIGAGANMCDIDSLRDGGEVVAHLMNAASRWANNIFEIGKIANEQRFSGGGIGLKSAIGHRLTTASLIARVNHFYIEALEQFQCCDPNLGKIRIDKARNK